MKKTYFAFSLAIVILYSSCAGQEEKPQDKIIYQKDTVTVMENSPILSGIKLGTVETELFSSEFRTVGNVGAESGKYAEVGVPFDGRIQNITVRIGNTVREGQTLFELSSAEFYQTSKEYFQSRRIYEKALSEYERKSSLKALGIVSEKEIDEAFTEKENARRDKECAESAIKVFGMNPDKIDMGQALTVSAPIAGEIVKCNLVPGAYLNADSGSVITIADLRKVWVTAQVKERFIGTVNQGAKTEIYTESAKDKQLQGKVIYIGNLVDPQTRSVEVIVECDNSEGILKHGMFVSVHFMDVEKEAMMIPSTAVFQGDSSSFVYVATDKKGCFVRRTVVTGPETPTRDKILIEEGLEKGEIILVEGGLFLNN